MNQTMRFGRRLAIPSTRQIRHELVVFAAQEEARQKEVELKRLAREPGAAGPDASTYAPT